MLMTCNLKQSWAGQQDGDVLQLSQVQYGYVKLEMVNDWLRSFALKKIL